MGRPQSISAEQILQAARETFLEEGFNASTASIAKRAGVSEGSIFKRFPTKEALFQKAMGLPDEDLAQELGDLLDGAEDIGEGLEAVVMRLVSFFREMLPRMMMLWANHSKQHGNPFEALRCGDGQPVPLVVLRAVSASLEQQQRKGRLRDLDPEIIARVLIGSSHNFAFFEVIGVHVRQPLASTSFARGVVELVLNGAKAPERSI